MQDLAYWEAMTRAGLSRVHEYDLAGWTERTGKPWELNTIVPVQDQTNGITGDFLIDGFVFTSNKDGGDQTTLRLVNPKTYKQPWQVQEEDPGNILGAFDQLMGEG
jgi:prophage tail gpP-like protein